MRRALISIVALVAGLAWTTPGVAADSGRVVTLDLPARGNGSGLFATGARVPRFTLAGVQWQGSGTVRFRTRGVDGKWSSWRAGAPEAEDGPDPLSAELSRIGWRLGNPWWVGDSNRIEARASGRVTRVRARLVWSPEVRIPYRRLAATETPAIVPRAAWGADESIRRGPPTYAPKIRLAIVHHTAGRNDYTRAEAPAVVKGIQLYHVQGNGWNDIGYNFLVDRFGTVYEGRYGGIDRNVVGAHALGFNIGSVGIALLGTYGSTKPSAAAQDALARLISWRLDLAHVDPTSALSFVSGGSERYASGSTVELGAVSGHRDTGSTECPGNVLYGRLGSIAGSARALGGQKIFASSVEATGSSVRFSARLAQPGSWAVTVLGAEGAPIATGKGTTTAVDWTWDASSAPAGSYTWSITAGGARPATGSIRAGGAATGLDISEVALEPSGISPNGDGQADSAELTYRLSEAASVSVHVFDAFGTLLATLRDRAWTRAGAHTLAVSAESLADGAYSVAITASTPAGEVAESTVPLVVSRTLGLVTATPATLSPNYDGRNDELVLTFSIANPATVRVRIEREGRWVATPLLAELPAGEHEVVWDGARPSGALRDGSYEAVVEAQDAVGLVSYGAAFVVDTTRPRVRFVSGRGIRLAVSEPSMLTIQVDKRTVRRKVARAGVVRIPWGRAPNRVRVVARDAAGNDSAPVLRIRPKKGERGQ
ncbi:MAG TPA: N-acetylmuramoyl-L-alanine amidase [Gaiellaceae bacterium]|nr:N-acetylmuramoyl-L-alanine amidase [Gaiellaceae bacterium]